MLFKIVFICFIFGCTRTWLLHTGFPSLQQDLSRGYSLAVVCGLLITVASVVVESGLQSVQTSVAAADKLSSCVRRLSITASVVLAHRFNCSTACEIFLDQDLDQCALH